MNLAEQLGRALAAARGDRPRRQLADEAGISNTALLNIEHGHANPTLDRVERLAAAYGVTVTITVTPNTAPASRPAQAAHR